MSKSTFLVGSDENENIVLTEAATGKQYTFYTPEAAWAFLKACDDNWVKVKYNE